MSKGHKELGMGTFKTFNGKGNRQQQHFFWPKLNTHTHTHTSDSYAIVYLHYFFCLSLPFFLLQRGSRMRMDKVSWGLLLPLLLLLLLP